MQANPPIIFRSYGANATNYGIGGRAPMEYGQAKSLAALPDVARTILITESKEGDNNVHMNEAATRFLSDADTFPGHLGTVVFAFAGGHAKAMRPTATGIPTNMWNIEEENNPPAAGDFGGTYDDLLARLTNWDTLCKSKS